MTVTADPTTGAGSARTAEIDRAVVGLGGRERAAYYDADDYRAFDPAPDQPPGLETDTGAS